MRFTLCLLAACFIQSSIGVPLGREAVSSIELNEGEAYNGGDTGHATEMDRSYESERSMALDALKWPNNTINYFYPYHTDEKILKYMDAAFEYIRSRTCINFINNEEAQHLLRIETDDGCSSLIGFQQSYLQNLWFGRGCLRIGAAVHELMHALGLNHEQSRYDRDKYLVVNESAVPEELKCNFFIQNESHSNNLTPFDYGSTMMYPYDAFATGSIRPKDMDYKYTIGDRRVSFYDMVKINKLYECEKQCETQLECKNGGYTNPANCNVCNCPHGYEGALCDQLPGKRMTYEATTSWSSNTVNIGISGSALINPHYLYVVITAPIGKTIEIQITMLENFTCNHGCDTNGVEVKYNGDPRVTNPIFCCNDELDRNRTYKSKQNPTIISLYTLKGNSTATHRFRYIDEDFTLGPKTTNGYDSYEYYK